MDQILSGIFKILFSFSPKKLPIKINRSWKEDTKIGNKLEFSSIILLPIPTHKESRDKAKPKYKASFESILFELSKSEYIGFLIICIVIPKDLIKRLYVLDLWFIEHFLFNAWNIINPQIKISIMIPIKFAIKFGNIDVIIFPNLIAIFAINKEIVKRIIFETKFILVPFLPYVIPIPKESILTEKASKMQFKDIFPPPKHT